MTRAKKKTGKPFYDIYYSIVKNYKGRCNFINNFSVDS